MIAKPRQLKLQVASERLVHGLGEGRDCQSKARTQTWQRDTEQVRPLEIMVTIVIKAEVETSDHIVE